MPASKISGLSSGSFVGMVADNPDEKIELKIFHSEIQNDHAAIKAEEDNYQVIPAVANVSALDVEENYKMIKADIADLIEREIGILRARKEAQDAAKQEVKEYAEAEVPPSAMLPKVVIKPASNKPAKRQSRKAKRMVSQRKKNDIYEKTSEGKPVSR